MALTSLILTAVATRLSHFPIGYTAAHVKVSDYESEYKNYLPKIVSEKLNPLFLSTDNLIVLAWVKVNIPSVTLIRYQKSQNRNIEAMCDLFMLANARTILPVPLINDRVAFSGFSRLASLMWSSLSPSKLGIGLANLILVIYAITGVRNPVVVILRLIAFTPLILQSRFSGIGVVAELRKLTLSLGKQKS
jgi:hypothetical protein